MQTMLVMDGATDEIEDQMPFGDQSCNRQAYQKAQLRGVRKDSRGVEGKDDS